MDADWVARATACAALSVAVYREVLGRLDVRAKRASKIDAELRPVLVSLRARLEPAQRRPEALNALWSARGAVEVESLAACTGRIADRRLRKLCERLQAEISDARGEVPPARGQAFDDEPADDVDQAAAGRALERLEDALERLDQLFRRAPA